MDVEEIESESESEEDEIEENISDEERVVDKPAGLTFNDNELSREVDQES
jgi:hypothetical protein